MKHNRKRRLLSMLLCLVLVFSLLPWGSITAYAEDTAITEAVDITPGTGAVDITPGIGTIDPAGPTQVEDTRLACITRDSTLVSSISFTDGSCFFQYDAENRCLKNTNPHSNCATASTTITFTLTAPAVLSFDYAVSSERFPNRLNVYLNDALVTRAPSSDNFDGMITASDNGYISCDDDNTQGSVNNTGDSVYSNFSGTYTSDPLPAGTHTLKLAYTSTNGSSDDGDDTGTISNIVFTPALDGTVTISGESKVGSPLTADCTGLNSGSAAPTCQWYRDDTAIAGATGASYTPVRSDYGSALSVQVTAEGYAGSVTSEPVTVGADTYTITLDAAGGTPESDSLTVIAGDAYGELPTPARDGFRFDGWYTEAGTMVSAEAAPAADLTLTAHWTALYEVVPAAAENGTVTADYETAAEGSTITLTVTPEDGYELDSLTVTDENGDPVEVTDNTFTMPGSAVTVAAVFRQISPIIAAQPQDVTAGDGSRPQLTVAATGEGLTYQWQIRTSTNAEWKNTNTTGNKTDTIIPYAATARDGYQYRCVITDQYGSTVTSDAATLTVTPAPVITVQPQDVTAGDGSRPQLTVAATGEGLTYQWQIRTCAAGRWKNTNTTGSRTDTIIPYAADERNGYQYRCIITDQYGGTVTSDAATLTVTPAPVITVQPQDVTAADGSRPRLTVTATGEGLTYQWQIRTCAAGRWKNTNTTGNRTDTIIPYAAPARNGYQYRCIITDQYGGTVTSDAATLTVE